MGFFAEFDAWLTQLLAGYIGNTLATVAAALEPAIVALGVLYVMVWGYLQLTGRIEEPFGEGMKRLLTLAVVLGTSLELWYYNEVIVDSFFRAPARLAAQVVGAFEPVTIVDQILLTGGDAAAALIEKGGILDGMSYILAGFFVYAVVGATALYTMFLLALSRVALAVLLALGPLFLAMLLFESAKRFFELWIAQLASFAFITVLTVLVAALMLELLTAAAAQAAAAGDGIEIAHAVRVCLAAGMILLVMRQVTAIAGGLARGLALGTGNVMSRAVNWGWRGSTAASRAVVIGSARAVLRARAGSVTGTQRA